METETFKTNVQKVKTDKNLLTIQIKRTFNGCTLFLKSDIFENFFKPNGVSSDYYLYTNTDEKIHSYNYRSNGNRDLDRKLYGLDDSLRNGDGYLNASFLKMVGLTEGVQINLSGVYSKESIKSYIAEMKDFTRTMYNEFMCPINQSVQIIVKEESN